MHTLLYYSKSKLFKIQYYIVNTIKNDARRSRRLSTLEACGKLDERKDFIFVPK